MGSLAGSILYIIFITGVGTAALTKAVSQSYFGEKIGILEAYRQLGLSWLHILITLFLFGLFYIAVSIWLLVPLIGWFTGPGMLVFLFAVVMPMLPAVVVLEKKRGFAPVSRAWDLGRRRFWWLLGFAAVFYLFNLVVVTGPTLLLSSLGTALLGQGIDSFLSANLIMTLISTVAAGILQLFALPIELTAWILVYFDLRVRTEGFDLALSTLGTPEGAAADISSLPTAATASRWLTGEDLGKFAVVSLVIIGFYGVFIALGMAAILGLGNMLGGSF